MKTTILAKQMFNLANGISQVMDAVVGVFTVIFLVNVVEFVSCKGSVAGKIFK